MELYREIDRERAERYRRRMERRVREERRETVLAYIKLSSQLVLGVLLLYLYLFAGALWASM